MENQNCHNKTGQLDYLFVIPIRNEVLIIEKTIETLYSFLQNQWENKDKNWKIVIADNGSTDGGGKKINSLLPGYKKLDYFYTPETGRGQAIKKVAAKYQADYYCYIDADLPINLNKLSQILSPLKNNTADLVLIKRAGQRPLHRKILTLISKILIYLFFDLKFSDIQCGCKAFNGKTAALLPQCQEKHWFLDTELTVLAKNCGLLIEEVETDWIEKRYEKRKTTVKFISSSRDFVKAILRITRKNYPSYLIYLSFLIGLGFLFLFFTGLNKFFVSTKSGHLPDASFVGIVMIRYIVLLFGLASLALFLFSYWLKKIPPRLALAIITIFFLLISFVAITTPPTRSQDIYWNLLLTKGFTSQGLNPYQTTPLQLQEEPLFTFVSCWRDLPMTHGPLWVLFLSPLTYFNSIALSLILIKIIILLALLLTGFILYKIMLLHRLPLEKIITIFLVLAWNPFITQNILVDIHNDIFITLSLVASYYFILKKKHLSAAMVLIIGGFIKYIPWLFLLIPLAEILRQKDLRQTIKKYILIILLFCACAIVFYAPFGLSINNLQGITSEYVQRGSKIFSLFGAALLQEFLRPTQIRSLGLALFLFTLTFLIYKRKILLAYIIPTSCLFFLGTPWFMPWYILWILPFLGLAAGSFWITALSILFLLFTSVLIISSYLVSVVAVFFLYLLAKKYLSTTKSHL